MVKVLVTAVVMANLVFFSRYWRPQRGMGLYRGVQGAALGCACSCLAALILTLCFPGPYRLSIYTLSLNLLLTPSLATAGIIYGLRRPPKPEHPNQPPSLSFSQVLAQLAGPQAEACEEPAAADSSAKLTTENK
jgi:hypothetical protein